MAVRKTTLLNGADKRPTPPTAHPHMRGVPGGAEVNTPTRGKALVLVEINPGTRSRRNDSLAGTATPAAIVDRAAPGAVKSRRV